MDVVKIGLIGVGNMGSAHFACIGGHKIRGLELAAVCDIKPERLEYCRKIHPEIPTYEDWHTLVNLPELDAVLIAVPHPLHALIAMAALDAGKHVLTEKPVDISVTKAKALNEKAQASGKIFGIMFNQRTNALFQKAREIVRGGELGEMKRTVWIITNWYRTQHYYNSGSWRATWVGEGGGVLLNQAPHNLDLWQWICGMPSEVTGFCDVAKYHNIEVEDDVTIFTRYPNGATGAFLTSTGEYPGTNRLEISGSKGKIVLENGVLKWWKLDKDERDICFSSEENSSQMEPEYVEILPDHPETAHPGILQNFTDAILTGSPLLAPGIDGVNELTISNAAYLSSWNGSRPVKLPMDGTDFDEKLEALQENSRKRDQAGASSYQTEYAHRWQINW